MACFCEQVNHSRNNTERRASLSMRDSGRYEIVNVISSTAGCAPEGGHEK